MVLSYLTPQPTKVRQTSVTSDAAAASSIRREEPLGEVACSRPRSLAKRCIDLNLVLFIVAPELQHIRNSLPDEVVVQRVEERLSALGNCISCNDYVALIHPDMDRVLFHPQIPSSSLLPFLCPITCPSAYPCLVF
jgi:hypothetical protein